jgi:hypothetical protein
MDSNSIVDYLKSQGVMSDFDSRKHIATKYGITDYTGTAEQNIYLLGLLHGSPGGRIWAEIKALLNMKIT